ncbi:MAG: hypothetical protein U5L75_01755 [Candidatus Campbellbacteria bacterium]|nr:hypothetical protein [Candidatus Campbellbacteria bacterium]
MWVFLFFLPGALSLLCPFISRKLGRSLRYNPLYGVIAGYGAYSVVSFLVIVFGDEPTSVGWLATMFLVISVAVLFSERYSREKLETEETNESRQDGSGDLQEENKEEHNNEFLFAMNGPEEDEITTEERNEKVDHYSREEGLTPEDKEILDSLDSRDNKNS